MNNAKFRGWIRVKILWWFLVIGQLRFYTRNNVSDSSFVLSHLRSSLSTFWFTEISPFHWHQYTINKQGRLGGHIFEPHCWNIYDNKWKTKCAIYLHIFTLFAFNQKLAKFFLTKRTHPWIHLSPRRQTTQENFSFPKSFVHFLLSHLISFFSVIHNVMLSLQSSRGNETQKWLQQSD